MRGSWPGLRTGRPARVRRAALHELSHPVFTWPQHMRDLACSRGDSDARGLNAGPRRRRRPASVFKKIVMAVSGILMLLFLIAHMIGNLHVFQGARVVQRLLASGCAPSASRPCRRARFLTVTRDRAAGLRCSRTCGRRSRCGGRPSAPARSAYVTKKAVAAELRLADDALGRRDHRAVHRLPHPRPDVRRREPGRHRLDALRPAGRQLPEPVRDDGLRHHADPARHAPAARHLERHADPRPEQPAPGARRSTPSRPAFAVLLIAGYLVVPAAVVFGLVD